MSEGKEGGTQVGRHVISKMDIYLTYICLMKSIRLHITILKSLWMHMLGLNDFAQLGHFKLHSLLPALQTRE